MIPLRQCPHEVKPFYLLRTIVRLLLEPTLYLPLINDVKVVTLVSLMEHILAGAHLDHFQAID